jgi:hypothetical protein
LSRSCWRSDGFHAARFLGFGVPIGSAFTAAASATVTGAGYVASATGAAEGRAAATGAGFAGAFVDAATGAAGFFPANARKSIRQPCAHAYEYVAPTVSAATATIRIGAYQRRVVISGPG